MVRRNRASLPLENSRPQSQCITLFARSVGRSVGGGPIWKRKGRREGAAPLSFPSPSLLLLLRGFVMGGAGGAHARARGEESKSKEMGQRLRSGSLGSAVKVDREISGNENRGRERRGEESGGQGKLVGAPARCRFQLQPFSSSEMEMHAAPHVIYISEPFS